MLWKSSPCGSWCFLTPCGHWRPIYSVSYWTYALRRANCSCALGHWYHHISSAGPWGTPRSWVGPPCSTQHPQLSKAGDWNLVPLAFGESSAWIFSYPSLHLNAQWHFIPALITVARKWNLSTRFLLFFLAPGRPPWIRFLHCYGTYFLKCTSDLVSLV